MYERGRQVLGLHASYYPISPETLKEFKNKWHQDKFWQLVSEFRKEAEKCSQECYIATNWHVLDYIVNPPDTTIPELRYAVLGHQFPAPDGSFSVEPHIPSYSDEYWQAFKYVEAEEVATIAQYFALIDESEFNARFNTRKMKGRYHAPVGSNTFRDEYFALLLRLQQFYLVTATKQMAVFISIG